MGYQVFPQPSSAVDLGKYSLYYAGSSAGNTPATTATINPNYIYYTTNTTVALGLYSIDATGTGEDANRRIIVRSSTADLAVATPSSTAITNIVVSTTPGTAFGFRFQGGWKNSGQPTDAFRYSTNNNFVNAKAFDQGYFAIMGGSQNGINDEPIKISTNGVSWTRYLPAGLSTSYYIGRAIWRGSTSYYALLDNNVLYQSTDIVNWTTASTSGIFANASVKDGMYDSVTGRHYLISNDTNIWWSTNITNWSTAAGAGSADRSVIKKVGDYLMIGGLVGNNYGGIEISTTGVNWTTAIIPTGATTWSTNRNPYVRDIAYNGTRYVAIGDQSSVIITSTDGVNWTTSINYSAALTNNMFGGVIWDGTYFIVGGYNSGTGGWRFSTDGTSWLGMATCAVAGTPGNTGVQTYVGYLFYNTNMGVARYAAFASSQYTKSNTLYSTVTIQYSTVPWGVPLNNNSGSYIINSYPLSVNVR
jgi:hypothetical protein